MGGDGKRASSSERSLSARVAACADDSVQQLDAHAAIEEYMQRCIEEYDGRELAKIKGYRVINRPYSVVQFLKRPEYASLVKEDYIFIAETDHIFMKEVPNNPPQIRVRVPVATTPARARTAEGEIFIVFKYLAPYKEVMIVHLI